MKFIVAIKTRGLTRDPREQDKVIVYNCLRGKSVLYFTDPEWIGYEPKQLVVNTYVDDDPHKILEKLYSDLYTESWWAKFNRKVQGEKYQIHKNIKENCGTGMLDGSVMATIEISRTSDNEIIISRGGYTFENEVEELMNLKERDLEKFVMDRKREAEEKAWKKIVELGGEKYIKRSTV